MNQQSKTVVVPLPFNPRSPEFRANPYPTYDYLRTHHPIYYRPERNDWVLTRYADISNVLKNPSFGRAQQNLASLQTVNQGSINQFLRLRQDSQRLMKLWLVLLNPPTHTRIRQLLRSAFTSSHIQALRSHIQTTVDDVIDGVKDLGKMDVINDLAYPLTLGLNCKILGIPPQQWHPDTDMNSLTKRKIGIGFASNVKFVGIGKLSRISIGTCDNTINYLSLTNCLI